MTLSGFILLAQGAWHADARTQRLLSPVSLSGCASFKVAITRSSSIDPRVFAETTDS